MITTRTTFAEGRGKHTQCISHQQDHLSLNLHLNAVGNTKEGISTQTCSFHFSHENFDNTVTELLRRSSKVTLTMSVRQEPFPGLSP